MKKFISILLFVSFILTALPYSVTALSAIPQEAASLDEDASVFMCDYENGFSISSGSSDRWNKFNPRTTATAVTDPTDGSNRVGYFAHTSSTQLMKDYVTGTYSVYAATSFMIPTPGTGGSFPTAFTVKLGNATVMTFSYRSSTDDYLWQCRSLSGTYLPDSWMRIMMYASVGDDGWSDCSLSVTLSGALLDGDGDAMAPVTLPSFECDFTSGRFQINMTASSTAAVGFYLDDSVFYEPCGVLTPTVTTEHYSDGAKNVKLDGKVTVKFNHELAPDTDPSLFSIKDGAGQSVPVTAVTFSPLHADVIEFDFSEDPLSVYTDYTVSPGEGTCDVFGVSVPTMGFYTMGTENSIPRYIPTIPTPKAGYIMPDIYNTGYRCDEDELEEFSVKYGSSTINDDMARQYNYTFSGFRLDGGISVKTKYPVLFEDFFVNGTSYYAIQNFTSPCVTLRYGEIVGSSAAAINGSNMILEHLFIHDVRADHIKGCSNLTVRSCYVRDGGTRSPGSHADVIQVSGSSTDIVNNIRIVGNRFDVPPMMYDHVANATIFVKPENGTLGVANLQATGNWLNGGGHTVYLLNAYVTPDEMNYIVYTDNKYGYGYNFSPFTQDFGDINSIFGYSGNGFTDTLEAGSVLFYDGVSAAAERVSSISALDSGSLKIAVNFANYTLTQRSYRVVVKKTGADGTDMATYTSDGTVRRYIAPSEYLQWETEQVVVDGIPLVDGSGNPIMRLKVQPDLPSDVTEQISLSDIGTVPEGGSIRVYIYDTTDDGQRLLRSCELSDTVHENIHLTTAEDLPMYTVDFYSADGDVWLRRDTVCEGTDANAPAYPVIEGMTFTGWSSDITNITEDMTVFATYESSVMPWDGVSVATGFFGGTGTAVSPYLISDPDELAYLAFAVNSGLTDGDGLLFSEKHYRLTSDIWLNATDNFKTWNDKTTGLNVWTPIGNASHPFSGSFDGDDHTVYGMYLPQKADALGLFGYGCGDFSSITVSHAYIMGSKSGTLLGIIHGQVTAQECRTVNSKVCGSVSMTYCGGLFGYSDSATSSLCATDCSFDGSMSCSGRQQVGGFVGAFTSGTAMSLTRCTVAGKVEGGNNIGGFCGNVSVASVSLTDCINRCEFVSAGGLKVGGFFGASSAVNYLRCVNHADVTQGSSQGLGGFVGLNSGASCFVSCRNYGSVTAGTSTTQVNDVGGFIGQTGTNNQPSFYNCVNYGNVCAPGCSTGGMSTAGGFVGYVGASTGKLKMMNCINYGKVTAGTPNKGTVTNAGKAGGIIGNMTLTYADHVLVNVVSLGETAKTEGCTAAENVNVGAFFGKVTNQRGRRITLTACAAVSGADMFGTTDDPDSRLDATQIIQISSEDDLNALVPVLNDAADELNEEAGQPAVLSAWEIAPLPKLYAASITMTDTLAVNIYAKVTLTMEDFALSLCIGTGDDEYELQPLEGYCVIDGVKCLKYTVDHINPADMDRTIVFRICSGGTEESRLEYGILTYAANKYDSSTELGEWIEALIYYGNAAQKAAGKKPNVLYEFSKAVPGFVRDSSYTTRKYNEILPLLTPVQVTPLEGMTRVALELTGNVRPVFEVGEDVAAVDVTFRSVTYRYYSYGGYVTVGCLCATSVNSTMHITLLDRDGNSLGSTDYRVSNYILGCMASEDVTEDELELARALAVYMTQTNRYAEAEQLS